MIERERILLQYFSEFIAIPATSGSKKQRLKLVDFDWVKKCAEIAKKTEGLSGRELSKLVLGWQVNNFDNFKILIIILCDILYAIMFYFMSFTGFYVFFFNPSNTLCY